MSPQNDQGHEGAGDDAETEVGGAPKGREQDRYPAGPGEASGASWRVSLFSGADVISVRIETRDKAAKDARQVVAPGQVVDV